MNDPNRPDEPSRSDNPTLPNHRQRRQELLAAIDAVDRRPRGVLIPLLAAGAVLLTGTLGALAVRNGDDGTTPAPAGLTGGQKPSEGVAKEKARTGDPVPWDVAVKVLAQCLDNGRKMPVPPPMPAMMPTGRPTILPGPGKNPPAPMMSPTAPEGAGSGTVSGGGTAGETGSGEASGSTGVEAGTSFQPATAGGTTGSLSGGSSTSGGSYGGSSTSGGSYGGSTDGNATGSTVSVDGSYGDSGTTGTVGAGTSGGTPIHVESSPSAGADQSVPKPPGQLPPTPTPLPYEPAPTAGNPDADPHAAVVSTAIMSPGPAATVRPAPAATMNSGGGTIVGPAPAVTMNSGSSGSYGPSFGRSLWNVTEPDSAFKPYFTAWAPDGNGGLSPYVLGKSTKPGLIVCHGAIPRPDLPAPTASDGWLTEVADLGGNAVFAKSGTSRTMDPVADFTYWGRATPEVARVELTAPDGSTHQAVIRHGIWFAAIPAAPATKQNLTGQARAYDKTGAVLVDNLFDRPPRCYRTPDGQLLPQSDFRAPQPLPDSCKVAVRWQ